MMRFIELLRAGISWRDFQLNEKLISGCMGAINLITTGEWSIFHVEDIENEALWLQDERGLPRREIYAVCSLGMYMNDRAAVRMLAGMIYFTRLREKLTHARLAPTLTMIARSSQCKFIPLLPHATRPTFVNPVQHYEAEFVIEANGVTLYACMANCAIIIEHHELDMITAQARIKIDIFSPTEPAEIAKYVAETDYNLKLHS